MKFIFNDLQFKAIKDHNNIEGTMINVVSRDEHVENIERYIQVIKECIICYWTMFLLKKIPKRMICTPDINSVILCQCYLMKSGISDYLSPMIIVEGSKLDHNKHFKVIPGEYA